MGAGPVPCGLRVGTGTHGPEHIAARGCFSVGAQMCSHSRRVCPYWRRDGSPPMTKGLRNSIPPTQAGQRHKVVTNH